MNIVSVIDGGTICSATKIHTLPGTKAEIADIVSVLTGQHSKSRQLLNDVTSGSVADRLGADKFTVIAFEAVPPIDSDLAGVFGVVNWINEYLTPAMPAEESVATPDLVLLLLVGNAEGTEYHVDREPNGLARAISNNLRLAYGVVLCRLDREHTPATLRA